MSDEKSRQRWSEEAEEPESTSQLGWNDSSLPKVKTVKVISPSDWKHSGGFLSMFRNALRVQVLEVQSCVDCHTSNEWLEPHNHEYHIRFIPSSIPGPHSRNHWTQDFGKEDPPKIEMDLNSVSRSILTWPDTGSARILISPPIEWDHTRLLNRCELNWSGDIGKSLTVYPSFPLLLSAAIIFSSPSHLGPWHESKHQRPGRKVWRAWIEICSPLVIFSF